MSSTKGFTLIELVVTLTILAIISAVAIPAYTQYTRRAARSDAMTVLNQLRLRQEQYRFTHPTYAQTLASVSIGTLSTREHYGMAITQADSASFVATATPRGSQSADACGTFAIDQDGPLYSQNATQYADAACWQR